ncbi:MAG: phosphatidate cytidylyltransferase, partial [Planctomycetota bacterium]
MFRNVPNHILWAIVGLYALLVVASLVTRTMRARAADPSKLDELTARIKSWWVMVTIFSIAIVVGRVVSL